MSRADRNRRLIERGLRQAIELGLSQRRLAAELRLSRRRLRALRIPRDAQARHRQAALQHRDPALIDRALVNIRRLLTIALPRRLTCPWCGWSAEVAADTPEDVVTRHVRETHPDRMKN